MSVPGSTPSILLLSLPPSLLCGIDLLSFTTSPRFLGIKGLPPGYHFLYTSETTSLSLRDGFWFHVPTSSAPALLAFKWSSTNTCLEPCSDDELERCKRILPEVWNERLTPYRQSAGASSGEGMDEGSQPHDEPLEVERDDWGELTAHITPTLLTRLTNSPDWRINSASCAAQDADHIPGLGALESHFLEQELRFLGIDLKRTWREGAVGRERTEAAVDRSWALEDVEARWKDEGGDVVLGRWRFAF